MITWPATPTIPDGTSTVRVPSAAAIPTSPVSTSWPRPSSPIPMTLPVSSCHGRSVASRSSTTRLDFSSTTPSATQTP